MSTAKNNSQKFSWLFKQAKKIAKNFCTKIVKKEIEKAIGQKNYLINYRFVKIDKSLEDNNNVTLQIKYSNGNKKQFLISRFLKSKSFRNNIISHYDELVFDVEVYHDTRKNIYVLKVYLR